MSKKTKRRDMRILWSSNPPWSASGYGRFTEHILPRIKKDGWPIALSAFTNFQGSPIQWEGIKVYSAMDETFGSDAMNFHGQDFNADTVISFQDVPPLNPQQLQKIKHWVAYVPVDRQPTSAMICANLHYAYKILSLAKFGKDELSKSGFYSKLIPEGTDINIFKPLDKEKARKSIGIPTDKFVVGMVGANKENPPRKGWQEAMTAFKEFSINHPDSILFINFQQQHVQGQGFPIMEFGAELGITDKIFYPNDYKARFASGGVQQNEMYNTYDLLLHPSQTEGFGLCIVEAQAAGVPAVIQNSHSMPELIVEGKTGWGASTLYKQYKNDMSYFSVADPKSVLEAMENAYAAIKADPAKVANDCRANIVDNYNVDKQYAELWQPFLEGLQEEILPLTTKSG